MRTRIDARRPRGGVGLLLAAALIAGNAAAFAQGPSPGSRATADEPGVCAAARRPEGAAVLRHLPLGALAASRIATRQRRLRPDHRLAAGGLLAARDRGR